MARTEDLTVFQGTDANFKLFIKESDGETSRDLTDKLFDASLKKSYTATESVDFAVSVTDAANGIVEMSLTNTQTTALEANSRYVYDVIMYESGNTSIEKILEGKVFVKPTVTRVG
jgi:hypothetical protein